MLGEAEPKKSDAHVPIGGETGTDRSRAAFDQGRSACSWPRPQHSRFSGTQRHRPAGSTCDVPASPPLQFVASRTPPQYSGQHIPDRCAVEGRLRGQLLEPRVSASNSSIRFSQLTDTQS